MNRLLLVRHAEPDIDPVRPSSEWELTERASVTCTRVATALSPFQPTLVVSSPERRARQTGEIVAQDLRIPLETDAHFAEHGAGSDAFIPDYEEFRRIVQRFFAEPDAVVLRQESSRTCAARFDEGVRELEQQDGTVIVVTHGRIMASWLGDVTGDDAWTMWTNLRMPDVIEVDLQARTSRPVPFALF